MDPLSRLKGMLSDFRPLFKSNNLIINRKSLNRFLQLSFLAVSLTQLVFRKTKTQILCGSSCEPGNVLIFQVRGEVFSELEACIAEMCFDGAFGTFHTRCDGFDRHFMNIV